MTLAAKSFAQIYGVYEAQRFGHDIEHYHLQQTSASLSGFDQFGADFGSFVQKVNKGFMQEMQAEPSDTTHECYKRTAETNSLIAKAFDFPNFSRERFDVAEFSEKLQVSLIKGNQELEDCGYNKFLIAFDTFSNNIPQAAAAGANLVTQIATGWNKSDTSIYLAWDKLKKGQQNNWDIEVMAAGLQLGFSQLLKVNAEPADVNVEPTN